MSKLSPDVVPGARVRVKIKATDAGETTTGELVGTVDQVNTTTCPLKLKGYGWVRAHMIDSVEVQARPRMAEPPAGTTVRHAGSIFARPLGQVQPDYTPWVRVDRRSSNGGCRWMAWDGVLELDTERNPEVIDPRLTAPETAMPARPTVQRSGLGVRAAEAAQRARGMVGAPVTAARELSDAVTLLARDLAQVEGALAAAKQRDKDAADATRRVITTVADMFQDQAARCRVVGAETSADLWESARAVLLEQAAKL